MPYTTKINLHFYSNSLGKLFFGGSLVLIASLASHAFAAEPVEKLFREQVQPILQDHCIACHGGGPGKGGLSFDEIVADKSRLGDAELWWNVLKNVRAGIMPPAGKPRLTQEEQRSLEGWIKSSAFRVDASNSDPGRVTVRRLNRVEYRNTIRELMGVDYDTSIEFPADDSGHGFDNISDVLTLSPLLMEKYLAAAKSIVTQVVPTVPFVVPEARIEGHWISQGVGSAEKPELVAPPSLSYYEPTIVTNRFHAKHAGRYQLALTLKPEEKDSAGFDYNKCRVIFRVNDREVFRQDFGRQGERSYASQCDLDLEAGNHELSLSIVPLTPGEKRLKSLSIRIELVLVRGPFDPQFWVRPVNYSRFFPTEVPTGEKERRRYAESLLRDFSRKAFRRPVEDETVHRLVGLAERGYLQDGMTFEAAVAQAMAAILASPMFLFREEGTEPGPTSRYPLVDEHALASRLSYFLWSSMPDAELSRLADEHKLRQNLPAQLKRMLADPRSGEFVRNFVGQWLQARNIGKVPINAFAVIQGDRSSDPDADRVRARYQELSRRSPASLTAAEQRALNEARAAYFKSFRRFREHELNDELRHAMKRETEMVFDHILHQDRSLRELLSSDYTFLNERLANHYGITGVTGREMRLVPLPPGSPRGGVLTQGTVLAVTSNPDRTSPVKRGLFILDNLLGAPPPPPPPNIPPLEEAAKEFGGRTPTLRETLELHRKKPACSSCHDRMDPLGLALENFNALGRWRDQQQGQPVDPTGKLISGETFQDVRELKRILVDKHSRDFYRCLSEKMLTYALGRGLTYRDVETVDSLVERIEREGGRAGALISGIVESPLFQRSRRPSVEKHPNRADGSTAAPEPQVEARLER